MRPDIARSTAYALGDARRFNSGTSPSGYGNRYFEVTTAGTTAGSAPTFNYTIGGTTTDGGVVWTARNAWERELVIGTVVNSHNMTLAASVDARDVDGWFAPGKVMFVSGRDKGRVYRVAARRPISSGYVYSIRDSVAAGDTGFIWPDCDKTPDNCIAPFNIGAMADFRITGGQPNCRCFPRWDGFLAIGVPGATRLSPRLPTRARPWRLTSPPPATTRRRRCPRRRRSPSFAALL
jgi:hypothetical protein